MLRIHNRALGGTLTAPRGGKAISAAVEYHSPSISVDGNISGRCFRKVQPFHGDPECLRVQRPED